MYYVLASLMVMVAIPLFSMQDPLSQRYDEVAEALTSLNPNEIVHYRIPYAQSFILPLVHSPVIVKQYSINDPLDKDLTNLVPEESVFTSTQLWPTYMATAFNYSCRLTEARSRTSDTFCFKAFRDVRKFLCDGINDNYKMILGCIKNSGENFSLYLVDQSKVRGSLTNIITHQLPLIRGDGRLCSLMLEKEGNRFMYSVGSASGKPCKLSINYLNSCDAYEISTLETTLLFKKMVSVGNGNYLGITDTGALYRIWLDSDNNINHTEQIFLVHQHCFKDISVDNTVVCENGFKNNIVFLADNNRIYIACLNAFKKPTLLYRETVDCRYQVNHFYYNEGKIMLVCLPSQDVLVLDDNFEMLYLRALLKKIV